MYQGESISKFMVDKKLVVTGADGIMLLRMYLDPLVKDDDGETEAENQEESIRDEDAPDVEMNIPDDEEEEEEITPKPDNDDLEMNIPDEDD